MSGTTRRPAPTYEQVVAANKRQAEIGAATTARMRVLRAERQAERAYQRQVGQVQALVALGFSFHGAWAHVEGTCDREICTAHNDD